MIIITERNRDGAKIWIDVNHILQSNKPYVLKYARLIYNPDMKYIKAVDPSGGPMISLGFKIKNYKVSSITELKDGNIKLGLENVNS